MYLIFERIRKFFLINTTNKNEYFFQKNFTLKFKIKNTRINFIDTRIDKIKEIYKN